MTLCSHMHKRGRFVWFHNGKRRQFLALEERALPLWSGLRGRATEPSSSRAQALLEEAMCSDISLAPTISVRHTSLCLLAMSLRVKSFQHDIVVYSTESISLKSCTFLSAVAQFQMRVLVLMGYRRRCMPSTKAMTEDYRKYHASSDMFRWRLVTALAITPQSQLQCEWKTGIRTQTALSFISMFLLRACWFRSVICSSLLLVNEYTELMSIFPASAMVLLELSWTATALSARNLFFFLTK